MRPNRNLFDWVYRHMWLLLCMLSNFYFVLAELGHHHFFVVLCRSNNIILRLSFFIFEIQSWILRPIYLNLIFRLINRFNRQFLQCWFIFSCVCAGSGNAVGVHTNHRPLRILFNIKYFQLPLLILQLFKLMLQFFNLFLRVESAFSFVFFAAGGVVVADEQRMPLQINLIINNIYFRNVETNGVLLACFLVFFIHKLPKSLSIPLLKWILTGCVVTGVAGCTIHKIISILHNLKLIHLIFPMHIINIFYLAFSHHFCHDSYLVVGIFTLLAEHFAYFC